MRLTDNRIPLRRSPHPERYRSTTHGLVDFSEDVSSKDLIQAAGEGFDSIELMKRVHDRDHGPGSGQA